LAYWAPFEGAPESTGVGLISGGISRTTSVALLLSVMLVLEWGT
jgi:hypothetical protein